MTLSSNECDLLAPAFLPTRTSWLVPIRDLSTGRGCEWRKKEPIECFVRTFLAPTAFVAAMIWTIWAQAVEPITVLAPFNLTGPQAALGAPCYKGAELAVEKLNAAGGVLDRPIELIPIDTASEVSRTTNELESALERYPSATAGIGYTDSTFALDAGRAFQKAGIPFITPGATAPDLPHQVGSGMFLAAYGDDAQALAMAKYAALWVDESSVYTRTVGGFFEEFFRSLGGTVDRRNFSAGGATDFGDWIAAFKKAEPKPQAIYGASMPRSAVSLIEQVRDAGVEVPLLSGDGWDDEAIVEASKGKGINNIVFTTHLFLGVATPGMREFSEAYKQKFGSPPPNAFAPLGFDSVNLLAAAIERAGSTQPDAVRTALANTRDFQGLVGKIAYSPGKRVPDKPVAVIKIDDGVETLVWTWMPQSQ
jgi:branched-chain amino acid transport system substrate-binding protein